MHSPQRTHFFRNSSSFPTPGCGVAEPEQPGHEKPPEETAEKDPPLHDRPACGRMKAGQTEADPLIRTMELALHAQDTLFLLQQLPVE